MPVEEARKAFRARMKEAGLWETALARRESLKEGGLSGVQAQVQVVREFNPEAVAQILDNQGEPSTPTMQPETPAASPPEPESTSPQDSPRETESDASPTARKETETSTPTTSRSFSQNDSTPREPMPAVATKTRIVAWRELQSAVPLAKQATARAQVEWVHATIGTPVGDIDPNSVPSRGAINLLRFVETTAGGLGSFYEKMWVRLLPSKAEIEAGERFKDDGKSVIDMIDKVAKVAKEIEEELDTDGVDGKV